MLAILLLCAIFPFLAHAQDAPVLEFDLPERVGKDFDERLARDLYDAASAGVAHELNPAHPPELSPSVALKINPKAESEFVENSAGKCRIVLRAWDAQSFAEGVALCAMSQALDRESLGHVARRAVRTVLGKRRYTVSVAELSKERK